MKHWNPRVVSDRSRRKGGLPAGWDQFSHRRALAVSKKEVGLTLAAGLSIGIVIVAGQMAWTGSPSANPAPKARPYERPVSVDVIDGDTFRYGGEKIRIADIDTPETHPARCRFEAELGARATVRLRELLAAGPFELEPIDRDRDVYGRKLRVVTRNGQSIGDMLVAEGLARPYGNGRRPWC